jgi:hypothetical protein
VAPWLQAKALSSKLNCREDGMIKLFVYLASGFIVLFGFSPVLISAMYGGNPPAHIAHLLDQQMEVFAKVAPIIFAPFKAFASNEMPPDKK